MPGSHNADERTTNARTGSAGQPDKYLQTVRFYREGVQNLSRELMKKSWLELKNTSPEFTTVDSQLRDTILALENLGEDPKENRVDISAVLGALNDALEELYGVAVLADMARTVDRLKAFNKIRQCRKYLNHAANLMKF